jgi:hypothetical protein
MSRLTFITHNTCLWDCRAIARNDKKFNVMHTFKAPPDLIKHSNDMLRFSLVTALIYE